MTVDEMINELKNLSDQGFGDLPVSNNGRYVSCMKEALEGNGKYVDVTYQPQATPYPNQEGPIDMNHQSAPVLPVTIDAYGHHGGHHDDHDGLEGKDASFLSALHIKNEISGYGRDQIITTLGAKYDNALQTLESKFQMERAIKESEIRAERLAKETLAQINSLRADLQLQIQSEADRTRDLVRDMEQKRKDDELLVLRIGKLIPVPVPVP